MQPMIGRRTRLMTALGALLGTFLCSPTVFAQTCLGQNVDNCININIAGIAGADGNGNYDVSSYNWGEPGVRAPLGASPQLTFTRASLDSTTVDLMRFAANHRKVATADLQFMFMQTATATYHLVNVHFLSVMHSGANSPASFGPSESVTLNFKELDYTYQPILPNGQKNGPPVTFTWKFD
jgi:hypothetical protein